MFFLPCYVLLAGAFIILYSGSSLLSCIMAAVCFGFSYGGIQPAIQVWCMRAAKAENRGVANSTFFIGLDIGTGLGASIAGIFAQNIGYSKMYLNMLWFLLLALILFIAAQYKERKGAGYEL